MRKCYMMPLPSHARNDLTNSINAITIHLEKSLPEWGYQLTENINEADLIAGHAGQHNDRQPDVAHLHGLYPSAYPHLIEPWMVSANQGVVNSFMSARVVTAPSEWVADLLRRDCHINPTVIPWAIDFDEWEPGNNQGYVLWNKTRSDPVCDPTPITELAKKVPQMHFLSTFGQAATPNLRVIGRQTFDVMKGLIRGASIGLCTTKETFCIGALEFMAAGVPILGYAHGNMPNLVKHGINGFLCEPGDIDGLIEGLAYCLKHRETLGANAREVARLFTWQGVAASIAEVYDSLFDTHSHPKISVIIPCHNYAQYVGEAIASVSKQSLKAPTTGWNVELIIVNDGSTDGSHDAIIEALSVSGFDTNQVLYDARVIDQPNSGVANARNRGIKEAKGDYICCLDADDKLGDPRFLQTLADALDADRGLGIAFTGLQTIDADGKLGAVSEWPKGFSWEKQVDRHNQVPTCCMFRRDAWRRAGGYRSQYQPAEDAELFLRIVSLGFRAKQVTDAGWFHYRLHSGSLSEGVRTGKQTEPDWVGDKPFINDKQYPLAAAGIARPVRNYDRPKVSVIVPVAGYHIPYLAQALDSIERQTERYWEAIIVNDTGEPLPGLAPFPWARVIDTAGHVGAGAARNLGVKHATAPFVTFLDADDILMPTFLEKTLRMYQRTGRYVYTDWLSVNKEGMLEGHETPEFVTGDVFQKPVGHAVNILLKKAWHEQIGGFDESMVSWEDVQYFMDLAKADICGARVAEPLFIYRYLTGQRRERGETIKAEIIAAFNQKYGEYISGGKMCGCKNNAPTSKQVIQGVNGQPPTPDQLVRIVYNGPPGQTQVYGPITKTNYGYRMGGATFYVKLADLQNDQRFTPIAEIAEEKQSTPIPPPPPTIQRQPVAAL